MAPQGKDRAIGLDVYPCVITIFGHGCGQVPNCLSSALVSVKEKFKEM